MNGTVFVSLVALLAAPAEGTTARGPNDGAPSASTSEPDVESALRALDMPSPRKYRLNERILPWDAGPYDHLPYLDGDFRSDCPEALELLVRTRAPVDAQLLQLATKDPRLPTRYRATWVLVQRSNPAVLTILNRMAASKEKPERMLAWEAWGDAVKNRKFPPPRSFLRTMQRYREERNDDIKWVMAQFLVAANATPAIPQLIAILERDPDDTNTVNVLQSLKDVRAVPAIIKAADQAQNNRHVHFGALGRLPTSQGVDYLIAHLDEYGAVDALFETGSPKALPALRAHLLKLQKNPPQDSPELDLAITRIAVARLAEADPTETLFAIAVDPNEEEKWMRCKALRALCDYDMTKLVPRILAFYRRERSHELRNCCAVLLRDQEGAGITEAIVQNYLDPDASRRFHARDDAVFQSLAHRLGADFVASKDRKAYLLERFPQAASLP